MNKMIISVGYLLSKYPFVNNNCSYYKIVFLQSTQSIICYSCSSAVNSYCSDPFSSNGTVVTTISNEIYCQVSLNI